MGGEKGPRLVSMSALLDQTGLDISLNELRCLIQYEGVPVYSDGRTRTRYLEESGAATVLRMVQTFRYGRARYCNPQIHPTFLESEADDGK